MWKYVKISYFLEERKDRLKPDVANTSWFKRIEKINFSWKIFISDSKKTKTNMILVKTNDLVISWINVEKWALSIYKWKEDVLATIHYSSYIYNDKKINIEYLRYFLKSPKFKEIIIEQTWNWIKTEIKAKKILKLKIFLPDLPEQLEVLNKIKWIEDIINEQENISNKNVDYVKLLKQSILQEAIEWKLTKSWREKNKEIEPASVLLEKIKAEKEELIKQKKLKKQKELKDIWKDEISFEIPESWEWCRLWKIFSIIEYGTSEKCNLNSEGIPVLRMWNIQKMWIDYNNLKYLNKKSKDLPRLLLKNKDLLFNRTNSFELVWKTGIYLGNDDEYTFAWYLIRLRWEDKFVDHFYINYYINSQFFRTSEIEPQIQQQCWQANFNWTKLKNTLLPFPPLSEQKQIVKKVNELMKLCDELEKQTLETKNNSEKLMKTLLVEVFNK